MAGQLIDTSVIGRTIKALRLNAHLTQEALADEIGYSVRNIRRIETNGTANIEVINTFAETFKVSALDILSGCLLFLKNKTPRDYILATFVIHQLLLLVIRTCAV